MWEFHGYFWCISVKSTTPRERVSVEHLGPWSSVGASNSTGHTAVVRALVVHKAALVLPCMVDSGLGGLLSWSMELSDSRGIVTVNLFS